MENHHHHSSRVLSRLFPSSCRYNSIIDVVESSIIAQNLKNIKKIQSKQSINGKQSSSSNSWLFSTEDEEEGVISKVSKIEKEDEFEDFLSLSSNSSLSSSRNISNSCQEVRFCSWKRSEITGAETSLSSSSEVSTSSSIDSYNPLGKITDTRVRITLAEQLQDKSFHSKKGEKRHLFSESSVFPRKTGETEHLCFDSSVFGRKKEEMCSKSSVSIQKTEKSRRNTEEMSSKTAETEHLCFDSSIFCRQTVRKTKETEHLCSNCSVSFRKTEEPKTGETEQLCFETSVSGQKTAEIGQHFENRRCPLFIGGNIEESYAVEKESRDPYEDFMESIVEMIVEKKISGAKDLEKLLLCFLSLNSSVYHRVILDVFSEICEALFG